jgi:DNA replication protein DnaC
MKRQLDERLAAQLRGIADRIPQIPWARVDDPEFPKRITNERLIGLATKWTPAAGSALILGPSGIGKTSAVVALIRRLMEVNRMVVRDVFGVYEYDIGVLKRFVWTTGAEIANARDESRLGDEPLVLHRAKSATLLAIDEVGSEPASNNLMEVVDVRYAHHKPTIVTSGKTVEEFSKRYGDGLVRRLSYKPHGVPVYIHPPKNNVRKAPNHLRPVAR